MILHKAERKQSKIKLSIQGPSGSGKTLSSLLLAKGLVGAWSYVAIIDSENGSADLYAHLGSYNVLPLRPPFTPERYIQAIEVCEDAGMEAIIIDSISHEWEGEGGILNIHGGMAGNSFTNWSKLTPRHNAFVQKMLQSNTHIIATIRTKQDYILTDKNGKKVPEKTGLKGIQRDGMDYEFTLVFDLDIKHYVTASKDRTGLFMDQPPFIISTETGHKIKSWCSEGTKIEEVKQLIADCDDLEELASIYFQYPSFQTSLKQMFSFRKKQLQQESSIFQLKNQKNGITDC